MKTVWYLDDENVKHITVVQSQAEFDFLKERFHYAGVESNMTLDSQSSY